MYINNQDELRQNFINPNLISPTVQKSILLMKYDTIIEQKIYTLMNDTMQAPLQSDVQWTSNKIFLDVQIIMPW